MKFPVIIKDGKSTITFTGNDHGTYESGAACMSTLEDMMIRVNSGKASIVTTLAESTKMKALIWNYTMAVAKLYEAKHTNGNADDARQVVILAQQGIMNAFDDMFASLDELEPLRVAICYYARAFARERLAYRFGIGETAATNVARIKAQRELFARLAK